MRSSPTQRNPVRSFDTYLTVVLLLHQNIGHLVRHKFNTQNSHYASMILDPALARESICRSSNPSQDHRWEPATPDTTSARFPDQVCRGVSAGASSALLAASSVSSNTVSPGWETRDTTRTFARSELGGFWGDPDVHGWVNSSKDGYFTIPADSPATLRQLACSVRDTLKINDLFLAPQVGLEPTTLRLTVALRHRSACIFIDLRGAERHVWSPFGAKFSQLFSQVFSRFRSLAVEEQS